MNRIGDYSIAQNLPESLKRKNVIEAAGFVDELLHDYDTKIEKVLIYPVIDRLPGELVDALAVQLHCDFYDKRLSLAARRQLVKTSVAWHRIKGTPAAVEMLCQVIFHTSKTKEWFSYNGRPYFFRMVQDITDGTEDVTKDTLNQLRRAINTGKNVRSWLELLEFVFQIEDTVKYTDELTILKIMRGFEDYYPYGHIIEPPLFDGKHEYGGAAYADGSFLYDGSLLHNGITPDDVAEYFGKSALDIDELFLGQRFKLFDDVSAGSLLFDGGANFDGQHTYGGANNLPADLGIFFGQRQKISDKVILPTSTIGGRAGIALADVIPYGYGDIPMYNGTLTFGGAVYCDGTFNYDGAVSCTGYMPEDAPEYGGKKDLTHDRLYITVGAGLFDDVSAETSRFDGKETFDGTAHYGGGILPREQSATAANVIADDVAECADNSGGLSISYTPPYDGNVRFDGSLTFGGYSYADDLSGDLSLSVVDFDGGFCFDGSCEAQADGRLVTA